MDIVVQKYGGTSVADKEKLEIVIKKVLSAVEGGNKVVVVVSAQGKTTDALINKANEYCDKTYNKEMDLLLSTGEIQTVALLTMMLKSKGYDAIGLTGGQAGIITDSNFSTAKIKMIMQENITKHLESGKIVIVAGFQGIDKFGNITTLGRGGSDLSAVAIAASLKATRCEIYTDVDGVFSTDPNIISSAKLINNISYDEMLEAATAGAKVLHNRAVSLAKKYRLNLSVKNTRGESKGTVVTDGENIDETYNTKVLAIQKGLARITIIGENMYSNVEYISKLYNLAKENNVVIYMLSFSEVAINIIVAESNSDKFASLLHDAFVV
ncbi:MAG: aspartate kinase [Clostridia bacterium]|nr:aspartate kinase [Clostridia bacterium]